LAAKFEFGTWHELDTNMAVIKYHASGISLIVEHCDLRLLTNSTRRKSAVKKRDPPTSLSHKNLLSRHTLVNTAATIEEDISLDNDDIEEGDNDGEESYVLPNFTPRGGRSGDQGSHFP
jgi:hypothetical protein